MRIAIISTSFPESADGSEAAGGFVRDFASEMGKHAEVWVIAPGRSASVTTEAGVKVMRFCAPRLPLSLLKPANPLHWYAIMITLWRGRVAARQVAKESALTHILACWALPSGYWASSTGVPFSVWCLGSDIWSLAKIPVVRQILRSTLRRATQRYADGIALGEEAAKIADADYQFLPSSRRLPVKAGVAPPKIAAMYALGFLGRWHPNKGIDLLLAALEMLDDSQWRSISRVDIAGGGPMATSVNESVARLKAAGRPVFLYGFLDTAAAANFLDGIDILVIPSRIESIPVIFSDAMQARRPVISMPVGDLPDLLQRFSVGRLVSDVSAAALASALAKDNLDAAIHCAANCSRAADEFDVRTAVQRVLNEIKRG